MVPIAQLLRHFAALNAGYELSAVVPAKAGTHTPCPRDVARPMKCRTLGGYGSPPSRGRHLSVWLLTYFSSTTLLRSTPIPVISTSSTSPAFIHTCGLRRWPTPSGVPVAITSPGERGVKSEQNAMMCGTE